LLMYEPEPEHAEAGGDTRHREDDERAAVVAVEAADAVERFGDDVDAHNEHRTLVLIRRMKELDERLQNEQGITLNDLRRQ
jgi:hypothetical protein